MIQLTPQPPLQCSTSTPRRRCTRLARLRGAAWRTGCTCHNTVTLHVTRTRARGTHWLSALHSHDVMESMHTNDATTRRLATARTLSFMSTQEATYLRTVSVARAAIAKSVTGTARGGTYMPSGENWGEPTHLKASVKSIWTGPTSFKT